jgi:nicotinate-nucleotide pyrophosphorylase (carboxylating)
MLSEPVLASAEVREIIRRALAEDGVFNDITTAALVPSDQAGEGVLLAKEDGVIAGLPVAASVLVEVDPGSVLVPRVEEGARIHAGQELATVRGRYASLLRGERVALNLLQRLSGVATMAARAVEAVAGLPVRVVDTRKTTPGLRPLEKYAVRVGGAHNHRYNLADGVLIKDNHLAAAAARGLSIADVLAAARAGVPHTMRIEVEVDTYEQCEAAAAGGADVILLDNMSPAEMARCVKLIAGRALTEASGGITLENARAIAESGVDIMSSGALTHSAKALDISLDIETVASTRA